MNESHSNLPDVSVVIPVFNVAPYIKECAESLFKQTLQNIEYIFIDDASTDRSVEILQDVIARFPSRSNQIKIIRHETNKGISYTRQEGNSMARGKWIVHCDSDDYIEPNIYEKLFEASKGNDNIGITVCSYSLFKPGLPSELKWQGEGELTSEDFLAALCGASSLHLHGSLCNKLIKAQLWKENPIPDNLSYCEDEFALISIALRNPGLVTKIIPQSLYNYRLRDDSLTMRRDDKRASEIKGLIDRVESLKSEFGDKYVCAFNSRIIGLLYLLLSFKPTNPEFYRQYRKYFKNIKDNKRLNPFKKLELGLALKGYKNLSLGVGICNNKAKNFIKNTKRRYNKIKASKKGTCE